MVGETLNVVDRVLDNKLFVYDGIQLTIPDIILTEEISSTKTAFTAKVYKGVLAKNNDFGLIVKVIFNEPQVPTFNQRQRFSEGFSSIMERNRENYIALGNLDHMMRQESCGHSKEYCWFTYLDAGPTLQEFLEENPWKRHDEEFVGGYFQALSRTLYLIQLKGFSYRDLKEDNLYVRNKRGIWLPFLGDYDTPLNIRSLLQKRQTNPIYESIGSPRTMSPEGCLDYIITKQMIENNEPIPKNAQTVDWQKNDVFSVGMLLFMCYAGKVPGDLTSKEKLKMIKINPEAYFQLLQQETSQLTTPSTIKNLIKNCFQPEQLRPTMETAYNQLSSFQ